MSVHDAEALAGRAGVSNLKKALFKVAEEIDKAEGKDEISMKGAASLRDKHERLCEAVSLELRAVESRSPEEAEVVEEEVVEEEVVEDEDAE